MDIATLVLTGISVVISAVVGYGAAAIKVGRYANKVDSLEITVGKDDYQGIRKTLQDLRGDVIACATRLEERGPLIQRNSPISLTQRGEEFLKESGGRKFVKDHFDELLSKIKSKNPKTAYDIQVDALEIVNELENDDRLIDIKDFLFKDGSDLQDVFTVMAIELRDKALVELGMNVFDIDN